MPDTFVCSTLYLRSLFHLSQILFCDCLTLIDNIPGNEDTNSIPSARVLYLFGWDNSPLTYPDVLFVLIGFSVAWPIQIRKPPLSARGKSRGKSMLEGPTWPLSYHSLFSVCLQGSVTDTQSSRFAVLQIHHSHRILARSAAAWDPASSRAPR